MSATTEETRAGWREQKRGYYDKLTPEQKQSRSARECVRVKNLPADRAIARRARNTAKNREYREANRDAYNVSRAEYGRRRSQELRARVFELLGGCCKACGFGDWRTLQVDHIEGGGRAHRRRAGGYHYWKTVLDQIEKVQLLCANCHMIKTYRSETVPA